MKKIKIVNCNFHNHVTVLISEQVLETWLDHFPLAKLAKPEIQTNKKTNKQNKNSKFWFPQSDHKPCHSPNFRTGFGIMIGPFSSCEIGKTWGLQNEKKPYVKWEKARKPLSNGRKWANYLPRYHVTELISEQVSDFCFGHQKCPFWEWEKATFTAFPHFRKVTSGAPNKNLRPVLKFRLWRGYVVRNSLTFGYWKVVFSLFLILYRAFSQVRKPHVLPISQEENGPIMIPKTVLKSGLWRGR